MTAMYSIIKLDKDGRLSRSELDSLIEEKLTLHKFPSESLYGVALKDYNSTLYTFTFDPSKFIDEYYKFLEDVLSFNQSTLIPNSNTTFSSQMQVHDRIYFDFFINGFMEQLFERIQTIRPIELTTTRYCASIYSSTFGSHSTNSTPKEKLKQHLLSKMMQSTRLPNGIKCALHDALCDILDDYSCQSWSESRLLLLLKKKIRQVGILLGMLNEEDSEARFFLDLYAKNSYFVRKCAQGNVQNYEASKVFVFDLSFRGATKLYESKRAQPYVSASQNTTTIVSQVQKRGRVQVSKLAIGSLELLDNETFFEDLDFAGALNQKPETFLTSAVEIMELVTARNFPVHHLLTFLGTETDFMSSEQIRGYIKQHVDLSRPDDVHRIGAVFLEPNTDHVTLMDYQKASLPLKKAIQYTIRLFKNQTFTTKHLTELLLLPWIRRILKSVVIKAHIDAFVRSTASMQGTTAVSERVSYFVFPDQIIETKHQGQHQKFPSSKRQNCAAYLFEVLKQEIELETLRHSLPSDIEMHNENEDDEIYGHLGSILNGVRLCRKQKTTRIARKTYAVHFLKYFVQKPDKFAAAVDNLNDKTDQEATKEDVGSNKQDEKGDKQKTSIVEMNIDIQDHLALYPLIRKDANLTTECSALNNNRYCIQDKCFVATGIRTHTHTQATVLARTDTSVVFYVSDEIPLLGEYYISNTSFKKMHRFIVPIDDPTQPIHIQCTPEDYSILFTVSQGDDYKADFRCNDLMYYC